MTKKTDKKLTFFPYLPELGVLILVLKSLALSLLALLDIMLDSEKMFKLNWYNEPFIREDVRKLSAKKS